MKQKQIIVRIPVCDLGDFLVRGYAVANVISNYLSADDTECAIVVLDLPQEQSRRRVHINSKHHDNDTNGYFAGYGNDEGNALAIIELDDGKVAMLYPTDIEFIDQEQNTNDRAYCQDAIDEIAELIKRNSEARSVLREIYNNIPDLFTVEQMESVIGLLELEQDEISTVDESSIPKQAIGRVDFTTPAPNDIIELEQDNE